jgi:hypothetical protein
MSDEVDLVVVTDHKLAEEICKALKQAGIRHVDFWPEQMLRPSRAYSDSPLAHGFFRAKKVPDEGFRPLPHPRAGRRRPRGKRSAFEQRAGRKPELRRPLCISA